MPAKDLYHEAVKNALIKDGWTITADPYPIEFEDAELYPDLAIEKYISEEQRQRKIIIEIKSKTKCILGFSLKNLNSISIYYFQVCLPFFNSSKKIISTNDHG